MAPYLVKAHNIFFKWLNFKFEFYFIFCLATIAFLNGKFQVGLSRDEIEYIAKSSEKAMKISRRDISYVLSKSSQSPLIGGKNDFKDIPLKKHP